MHFFFNQTDLPTPDAQATEPAHPSLNRRAENDRPLKKRPLGVRLAAALLAASLAVTAASGCATAATTPASSAAGAGTYGEASQALPAGDSGAAALQSAQEAEKETAAVEIAPGSGGAVSAPVLTLPYDDPDPAQKNAAYPWICSDLAENVRKLDGLSETDDFHAAVNRDWLSTNSIPDGYVSYDTFAERQLEVDEELRGILESKIVFSDPYIAHCQKLVRDYYRMWLDWDARDAAGVEPLRKVLEPLLAVKTLDDFTAYLSDPRTTIEALPLCSAFTAANLNDADNNAVYINPPALVFQDPMYYGLLEADSWKTQPRYMYAAGYMLERLGYTESERDRILEDSYTFECAMAAHMMTTQEQNAEDASIRSNNPRTLAELEKEQGAFPLTGMLQGAGVAHSEVFLLEEPDWLACMRDLYDDAHLEQMKAYLLVSDVLQFMELLDRDCYDRMVEVRNILSGSSGQVDDKKAACDAVNSVLEMELGEVYAQTYVTDKTRTDVTGIIRDVIDYYHTMLEGADFLSDATRAEAIKKLENLTIRVASAEDHEEESAALAAADSAAEAGTISPQEAPGTASGQARSAGSADAAPGESRSAGSADAAPGESRPVGSADAVPGESRPAGSADAAPGESRPAGSADAAASAAATDGQAGAAAERILDFRGPEEGGSLVEARIAVSEDTCLSVAERVNRPVDRTEWLAAPQDVNAYYYPLDNSINIPAGILGGIFYSDQMPYEEKLGHVGVVVAHEISHAFDTSGRQYDERGNLRNWWTEEDYRRFHARAQKLVDYYSGFEPIEGYPVNGAMLDTEAIADLTGVKCMLRIAADVDGFDYDLFFRTLAGNWRCLTTTETEAYSIEQDSHPLAYLRTNAVVVQFEEFHRTYGTKEGDGMYLAPQYRLEIW